jgi:hypothetical protein
MVERPTVAVDILAEFRQFLVGPLVEWHSARRSDFDAVLLRVCIVVAHAE